MSFQKDSSGLTAARTEVAIAVCEERVTITRKFKYSFFDKRVRSFLSHTPELLKSKCAGFQTKQAEKL